MEYQVESRISKHEIEDAAFDVYSEVKRELAYKLIEHLSMDELGKIFTFKVIDPDKYVPVVRQEAELVNLLKEQNCVLFKAKINIV